MQLNRTLKLLFCAWVLALALYQFSENTADPDLWGHVVFGRQMAQAHTVVKTETFSWTARGESFLNHEYGFDLIVWKFYQKMGGPGILLLKTAMGLLVFWLCLRYAGAERMATWGLGALAVVEISFGFPARPQIFTALGLIVTLFALREIHRGNLKWILGLPLVYVVWINIHGGALAGVGLVGLTAGISTLEWLKEIRFPQNAPGSFVASPHQSSSNPASTVVALWFAVIGVIGVLFCNPWDIQMIRWLIGSLLWFRPEIQEWNPAPLGWDHAAFFIVLGVSAFAWKLSRIKWRWWELAAVTAFAVLAMRSVRNAPLFCIIALAVVPAHLEDALSRWPQEFSTGLKKAAVALLAVAVLGTLVATFTLHKQNPFTMEAPRSQYPMAAVDFIRAKELKGNLLVFFDWGDLAISQLPDCPPSIDGRLDACYSRDVIKAHWKFYNGESFDEKVLPVEKADIALLPSKLAGAVALSKRPDWRAVYFDDVAVVLVRQVQRFSKLAATQLPVEGEKNAAVGRAAFPGALR